MQLIFNSSCAVSGCHDTSTSSDDLSLDAGVSYANLVGPPTTDGGRRVIAGDSTNSVLHQRVSGLTAGTMMPLGQGSLSAEDQSTIQNWIDQGADNN